MNFQIFGAILRKDVRSLLPLVALIAVLFLADALIVRLDLLPVWTEFNTAVVMAAVAVLILSVFQLDSPASLNDDWLCRPVPKRELLAAKLVLVLSAVYLPRAIGTLIADLSLGFPPAEAFLDAMLLQDKMTLFLLPIFLFTAIITRTLVQGFGVLFAIFIGAFVIPTPFLRPPGPLTPGIREGLFVSGMQWLATTPAKLTALTLVAVGLWLVYWRHRLAPARILMALTVCVTTLLVVLPMGLLPGNSTFAIQSAFSPSPRVDTAHIFLRNPRACFPAARRAELSSDTDFIAATRLNDLQLWEEEDLPGVGPDSIAFITAIEPRGLPLDWRVKLSYVEAIYSARGKALYSLRPARYFVERSGGGSLANAWMLPEGAAQTLRDAQPELRLTYSLTLLEPREYRIATDAQRHAVPGLGWCSAKVDEPGGRIDVDCFSAFTHSAQVSVELNGIPASRAYSGVNFAPGWAKWPYGQRVKLAIASPRLAKHDSITVTAWEPAGTLQKSLTTPGLLGAPAKTCPLPAMGSQRFQTSRWRDTAPHESQSVTVEAGVQLEVLDFGGNGSPVLLLPGLGATAHSFDELAPLLAKKHRVVAMTRRGSGHSSKPDFGFDTPRLSQDVLQVMDAMGLEKVVLVGHSIAGEELTWLGGHYPDRFSGLIYLDAAYDRSGDPKAGEALRLRELGRLLPPEPPFPPAALENFAAMSKLLIERGHVLLPEGELIAFNRMNDPNLAGIPSIDARTQQAISAAIQAPDYAALKIPALAIYAFEPDKPPPPWYDPKDKESVANLAERTRLINAMKRENIDVFERTVEKGQVLEMQNAAHYIFQSNQREVLEAIEKFVGG